MTYPLASFRQLGLPVRTPGSAPGADFGPLLHGYDSEGLQYFLAADNTDGTGAANRANITALLARSGQCNLLPGTYLTDSPIVVPSFGRLAGAGRSLAVPSGNYGAGGLALAGSIIRPAATFAGASVISLAGSAVTQQGGHQLHGITIDGSVLPAGNTINGITPGGFAAGVTLRDVTIYGGYAGTTGLGGTGLDAEFAGANPDDWDCYGVKVSACKGSGIITVGLSDSIWVACEATGNNGDNWFIQNGSNSRYVACKGENSGTAYDLQITGFTGFTGYAEWIGFTGGGGALGAINVSGNGTGTFYFAATHIVSGAVTLAGTNTIKSTPAWLSGVGGGGSIITS